VILDDSISIAPTFTNAGAVSVAPDKSVTLSHDYTQTAGTTSGSGSIAKNTGTLGVALQGGVFSFAGFLTGNLTNTGGNVSPCGGGNPCTLRLQGGYTQGANGTLTADVRVSGNSDAVVIGNGPNGTNTASLAGTLVLDSTGFTPTSAFSFSPVEADDSLTGTFGTVSQVGGGGRTYQVNYLLAPPVNRVKVTVPPRLSVTRTGAGNGGVTSSPAGVDCGTTCNHDYVLGDSVTLTATPATGSTFTGWSVQGDSTACPGTGPCTVSMTQDRSVTANFALNQYSLSVTKDGNGSGSVSSVPSGIDCGATCSHSYDYGTSVTLTAAPGTGSTFTGWSGEGCSGTGTCTVSITQARSVTATFALQQLALSVAKAGTGSGSVSSTPSGIDCGATCSHSYEYGTSVTLTAAPGTGSAFTGWSGAGCSGTGTCTVAMTEARSVTATFTKVVTPDRTPPVASGLSATPGTFRATGSGGSTAAARPIGTTVRYRLSEAARVRFTVQRVATGRKVGKNCVASTRANRKTPRCTRYLPVRGSFTVAGRAGANKFKFTGRLGGVKLKPGVYRLSAVPTDAAGNRGRVVTVRFTIVR
jgi:hypothetical protein